MKIEWKVVHGITTEGLEFQLLQLQNQDWDIHTLKYVEMQEFESANQQHQQNMFGTGGQQIYYQNPTTTSKTKTGLWVIVAYRATPII